MKLATTAVVMSIRGHNQLFTPQTRAMSNGFEGLDEVSLGEVFEVRTQVMKTVPNFMKGVFRGGLKMSFGFGGESEGSR